MAAKKKAQALDSIDTAAAALRPAELRKPYFDAIAAKKACSTGLKSIGRRREGLEEGHPGIDLDELDELPALCDRLRTTQNVLAGETGAAGSLATIARGVAWRAKLMPVAESLANNGKLGRAAFEKILAGAGQTDQLLDVRELARVLRPFAALVSQLVGEDALAKAVADADAALAAQGSAEETDADLAEQVDRYATLIIQRHDRLRTAAACVFGYVQATELVPPLVSRSTPKEPPKGGAPA